MRKRLESEGKRNGVGPRWRGHRLVAEATDWDLLTVRDEDLLQALGYVGCMLLAREKLTRKIWKKEPRTHEHSTLQELAPVLLFAGSASVSLRSCSGLAIKEGSCSLMLSVDRLQSLPDTLLNGRGETS